MNNNEKYYLKPGFVYVTTTPTLIHTVLGSCVSICLYDKKLKYGGMNHFILPYRNSRHDATTQIGYYSIRELYRAFLEFGSENQALLAHLVGGGYINGDRHSKYIADENIKVARQMLGKLKIEILSEDTGDIYGRKLYFHTEHNKVEIKRIKGLDKNFCRPPQTAVDVYEEN